MEPATAHALLLNRCVTFKPARAVQSAEKLYDALCVNESKSYMQRQ
jgi:hypothetical protein